MSPFLEPPPPPHRGREALLSGHYGGRRSAWDRHGDQNHKKQKTKGKWQFWNPRVDGNGWLVTAGSPGGVYVPEQKERASRRLWASLRNALGPPCPSPLPEHGHDEAEPEVELGVRKVVICPLFDENNLPLLVPNNGQNRGP